MKKFLRFLYKKFIFEKKYKLSNFGYIDESVDLPFDIIISGCKNIYIEEGAKLAGDVLLYATHAKLTIKNILLQLGD